MTTWLTGTRTTGRIVRRARRHGRAVRVVSAGADLAATMQLFASALHLPDYFGHNLDALVDCLRDLPVDSGGLTIVVDGVHRLRRADPRGLAGLVAVLTTIEAERPEIATVVVER